MADPSDLAGVDLKLGRARRLLAELRLSIGSALAAGSISFELEHDQASGKHLYRVHGVPEIDPDWRLIAGEILYNLRSSLDHLAWQLVLLDGKTPTYRTQFPIRSKSTNQAGVHVPTQLEPEVASEAILRELEAVQPYNDLPGVNPKDSRFNPLWMLRLLSNIDKHRLLLVVLCVVDLDQMWWGLPEGFPSPGIEINPNAVRDGEPVLWFDFHGSDPPSGFDAHAGLQIIFGEPEVPTIIPRRPLLDVLDTFSFWVRDNVLDWHFRPLFDPSIPK